MELFEVLLNPLLLTLTKVPMSKNNISESEFKTSARADKASNGESKSTDSKKSCSSATFLKNLLSCAASAFIFSAAFLLSEGDSKFDFFNLSTFDGGANIA